MRTLQLVALNLGVGLLGSALLLLGWARDMQGIGGLSMLCIFVGLPALLITLSITMARRKPGIPRIYPLSSILLANLSTIGLNYIGWGWVSGNFYRPDGGTLILTQFAVIWSVLIVVWAGWQWTPLVRGTPTKKRG